MRTSTQAAAENSSEQANGPSAATIIRLLNLLKSDADILLVERELKREPVLSHRLLRFVNSASSAFHKSIASFRQAVIVLGYHQLHRWLAVMLVSGMKSGPRTAAVRSSLVRAAFMETLATHQSITLTLADQCFIVGVFSRLDELLGQPLAKALANLNLAPEITDALLKRQGAAAGMLELAILMESGDRAEAEAALTRLNVAWPLAERSFAAACTWADSLPV